MCYLQNVFPTLTFEDLRRSASRNTTPTWATILKSFSKVLSLSCLCTTRLLVDYVQLVPADMRLEFSDSNSGFRDRNRFSVNRVQFPYITAGNCRRLTDRETCSFRISNSIWIKKKSVSQTEKRVESEFRIRFDVLIPNFEFDLENSSLTSAETSHVRR